MRRSFVVGLVVALVLMLTVPAIALEEFKFDKSKVVAEVEYSMEEKDLDNLNVLSVNLGGFLNGDLVVVTDDLNLNTTLVKLGYEVAEQATPYILLGYAQLDFSQDLNGSISWPSGGVGTTLLGTEYDQGSFMTGVGMSGNLMEIEGIKFGYDLRWLRTTGEETDKGLAVLPDLTSINIGNKLEVEYNEVDIAGILSKEIDLRDEEGNAKIVQSVTPFVGYRYSMISLNIDSKVNIGPIGIANETNYEGANHSALFGAGIQVNDDINVKIAGVAGNDLGGSVAVGYSF